MKTSGVKTPSHGVAASGPFVEERTGTQELFRNRRPQEGHEVFLVRDEPTGELLLIHTLAIDAAASLEARNAVVTAARQALDFRHPAVLPVLKVEGGGQSLILAQSFPGGVLLRDSLARNGPLPPSHALQAMRSFADALHRAEAMRLTLSQISPQDFIVGKSSGNKVPPATFCVCPAVPHGWWLEVADPVFASPEQKHHQPCNVLSSLYSAGALLGHMLTGRQPAQGETWAAWAEHQNFAPNVKAALLAVLHEDPCQRSQSPAPWIQLLEQADMPPAPVSAKSSVLRTIATAPAPPPVSTPPAPPVFAEEPAAPVPTQPPVPRRTVPRAGRSYWPDAAALGAIVSVGFVLTWQARRSAEHAAHASRTTPTAPAIPVVIGGKTPDSSPPAMVEVVPETAPFAPALAPTLPSAPAPSVVVTPPPPSSPKPGGDISILPAQPASVEEELVYQARQATATQRAERYRKVLSNAPDNREALHEVVEDALADFPEDETHLRELRRWTSALERVDDPLGEYSRGRLLLEEAKKSQNLRSAADSLSTAVDHLVKAADQGYSRAWFLLLQGLVNLHNVQQQAGNVRQAARTERALFEKIEALPPGVPADDTRLLAERLEQLMAERSAKGRPHPQANFLRRVVQRLQTVSVQRSETVSQAP